MRLLLVSDLHCNAKAARRLVEESREVDVVIGAGDFGNQRRGLEICLPILREITKPAVLIAGNNESPEELRRACDNWPSANVLHGTSVTINDWTFFGLGGGVPETPLGDWSFDLSEADAAKLLQPCPENCILITHSPPKGWVDVSSQGVSLGSVAIRDAMIRTHPRLVVCGHIHASGGQTAHFQNTTIINAGPDGITWNL